MLQNYLVIALRNLTRHKLYSFINIAGLAVGLVSALLIILFARDELSYDKWIPGSAHLYRLELTIQVPGRPPLAIAVVPFPMPAAMHDQIPEVTGMTRLNTGQMTLMVGDRQFVEDVRVVDPNFFRIIKLPFIEGDPDQALRQPEAVVLSETMARKYFGTTNAVGKTMMTGRTSCASGDTACQNAVVPLKVTGVMRDLPYNSQLTGDVFLSNISISGSAAARLSQEDKQDWFSENGYGYVTLAPGTDPRTVIAKLAPILDRFVTGELKKFGINLPGSKAYDVQLTPFVQVHLASWQWAYNLAPPGSSVTLYGVVAIGLLILLVACFNFMNLATARALLRAREIGLRKTLGATRRQLILQFLGEAVLIALLSLALALAITEMLLPALDNFLQHPITLYYLADWPLLLLMVAVAMVAGLISGSYPALVLSGFRPALALRANSAGQAGSGSLRAILVVLQFAVSIGLGIAATVIFSQINFARNMDLGFHRDNILIVDSNHRLTVGGQESFVQTLRANPGILDAALSNFTPFDNGQTLASVKIPGQSDIIALNKITIGPDFPRLYGMRLIAGRMLSDTRSLDVMHGNNFTGAAQDEGHDILVNKTAAARMGFTPQQAIDKTILFNNNHIHIVGVLADAKFDGAREPVKATSYIYDPKSPAILSLRLRAGSIPQTLDFIDKSWRIFAPASAIRRHFLNENFDRLYRADERQGEMFGIFVGIAIFIACLGLFGLATFTAGRRTKEIGIRKVFGARDSDVVFLLLWQFSVPILIANLIAWPVAWYYLHDWLDGFAYRITLSPLYFVGVGLAALLIAWTTILSHALRVARANPIHALRYE